MNLKIIQYAITALKNMTDLCKKTMDAADPEKYANSVQKLNQEVDTTYSKMRDIIVNSEKFSDDEKLEKLNELAKHEIEAKNTCNNAIKGNREHVAKIAVEVFKGFLTCGISFAPAIIKEIKGSLNDKHSSDTIDTLLIEQPIDKKH